MRKLDKVKALDTLSNIEGLTSMPGKDGGAMDIGLPGIDGQVLELMVNVARRKGGLRLLVESYSASRSVILVGGLVLVLAHRAQHTKAKDAYLLFEFIDKLQRRDRSGVLVSALTAVKKQIGLAHVWHHRRMPESLYPFLQYCLEFTGAQAKWMHPALSDGVQLNAIDVLWTICEASTYNLNFDDSQRRWIEDKVREVVTTKTNNDMFQKDASYFFDCVNKRK